MHKERESGVSAHSIAGTSVGEEGAIAEGASVSSPKPGRAVHVVEGGTEWALVFDRRPWFESFGDRVDLEAEDLQCRHADEWDGSLFSEGDEDGAPDAFHLGVRKGQLPDRYTTVGQLDFHLAYDLQAEPFT